MVAYKSLEEGALNRVGICTAADLIGRRYPASPRARVTTRCKAIKLYYQWVADKELEISLGKRETLQTPLGRPGNCS